MRDGLLEANIMERSAALREAGAALTGLKSLRYPINNE
jgi:hypothetical protein